MIRNTLFLCISLIYLHGYHASKILGVSVIPSTSHQGFFNAMWKELSLRGHHVTAVTAIPLHDTSLTNLTEINVSFLCEVYEKSNVAKHFSKDNYVLNIYTFIKSLMEDLVDALLSSEKMKELIRSDEKFDVIIVEIHHPFGYAFGEKFKVPVIGKYLLFALCRYFYNFIK